MIIRSVMVVLAFLSFFVGIGLLRDGDIVYGIVLFIVVLMLMWGAYIDWLAGRKP
jgi:hypothetical protein